MGLGVTDVLKTKLGSAVDGLDGLVVVLGVTDVLITCLGSAADGLSGL